MRATLDRLHARQGDEGFTLIELLIVIVILGILAAIVVFSVAGLTNRGDVAACQSDVKTVAVAEEAFYAQTGGYAATSAALKSAGFIHNDPGAEVTIAITAGPPASVSVTGSGTSKCSGFVG